MKLDAEILQVVSELLQSLYISSCVQSPGEYPQNVPFLTPKKALAMKTVCCGDISLQLMVLDWPAQMSTVLKSDAGSKIGRISFLNKSKIIVIL